MEEEGNILGQRGLKIPHPLSPVGSHLSLIFLQYLFVVPYMGTRYKFHFQV